LRRGQLGHLGTDSDLRRTEVGTYAEIYFVTDGTAIKIGMSTVIKDRIASLQTSHHASLRLLGTVRANPDDEKQLHKLFEHLWIRGNGILLGSISWR
jgi:hypothetical protein